MGLNEGLKEPWGMYSWSQCTPNLHVVYCSICMHCITTGNVEVGNRGLVRNKHTRYVNMKPEFLYRKYTFIVWKWLKIFYSKYCPSLAIHATCLAIGGCHAKKTVALLRQTTYRAIFVHFRKKWSAGQKVRVPSMQINNNRTEPNLVSKPRAKVFPNWTL